MAKQQSALKDKKKWKGHDIM